jgi:hypothetical protein
MPEGNRMKYVYNYDSTAEPATQFEVQEKGGRTVAFCREREMAISITALLTHGERMARIMQSRLIVDYKEGPEDELLQDIEALLRVLR